MIVGPTFFSAPAGDHPAGDGLTRLQTTFAGASSADISSYAIGSGVLTNTAGHATVNDGYLEIAYTVNDTSHGLTWTNDGLQRIATSVGHTIEFFVGLFGSYDTTKNDLGTHFAYIRNITSTINLDSEALRLTKQGSFAPAYFGGSSSSTGIWAYPSGPITPTMLNNYYHVAYVWSAANRLSIYVNGVRQLDVAESGNASSPGGVIQLGSGTPYYWTQCAMRYSGIRVRRAAMYSGASFTPPASPIAWGPP